MVEFQKQLAYMMIYTFVLVKSWNAQIAGILVKILPTNISMPTLPDSSSYSRMHRLLDLLPVFLGKRLTPSTFKVIFCRQVHVCRLPLCGFWVAKHTAFGALKVKVARVDDSGECLQVSDMLDGRQILVVCACAYAVCLSAKDGQTVGDLCFYVGAYDLLHAGVIVRDGRDLVRELRNLVVD